MRVLCILFAIAMACAPFDDARAGAFTLAEGEAKLFVLGFASGGDRYFDAKGDLKSRGRYRKFDLQGYGEYGLRDGLTVFAATGLQKIDAKDGGDHVRKGLGRSEFGARARLFERDGWIVSAQASGVLAGAKESRDLAVVGETDDQLDFRGLLARSFALFGKPAFVDVGAGYRVRGGDPADEIRIDATLGVRPVERLLLMVQSFNQIGTGRWSGPFALRQRISKLQGAAMLDLTERLSLIAAAFFSPVGRDALDERGGTLGLGYRF